MIAEGTLGCRIDRPDGHRDLNDVTRDADALQGLLDVAAGLRTH